MKKLDYYVMDVLSIVKDLPFDYVNAYETLEEAKRETERLMKEKNIVRILIFKWYKVFNDEYEVIKEEVDKNFQILEYEGE